MDVLSRLLPPIAGLRPPAKIAVLRLHGPIMGAGRAAEWTELARRVRRSKGFAAAVLDIDSPGGSAAASDGLYLARSLGLVDEVGDFERAIEVAAELARVPPRPVRVEMRRPLLGRLIGRFSAQATEAIADEIELRLWERFRL